MIPQLVRFAALGLATPLGLVVGAWHDFATGRHAVVDVEVKRLPDAEARTGWLESLRRLADDPRVDAVVFRIDAPPGNWAAGQDLRGTIAAIRAAGKATYAFVESPGHAALWIATACDQVFCVPTGELQLFGIGVEMTFFGAALERLGVVPDFEAAGAYKSFGEPFMRSFASPANLEAVQELVKDLHQQLLDDVARDRDLTPAAIQALMDRAPLSAEEGVVNGLLDQLLYKDELDRWIEETHGERAKRVEFDAWKRRTNFRRRLADWGRKTGTVAVLHLDGGIVMEDRSSRTLIRARTVIPLLEKLREDEDVDAVVLHVNSPGGSALASDLIWREVEQLRRRKPVVAAFEDVAASGGYYLSAPATEIVARPGTLTGSIGVFGGKPVIGEGLRKVGVKTQTVLAAEHAAMFSPSRRFSDSERDRFRAMLQRMYDGFVHRVAQGRRQPEEDIEPHCRGRVWTGTLAEDRGLVDQLGTLADAVERARILAGLKRDHRRRDLSGQPSRSFLQRMLQQNLKEAVPQLAQVRWVSHVLDRTIRPSMAEKLELVAEHEGQALALLPWDVDAR